MDHPYTPLYKPSMDKVTRLTLVLRQTHTGYTAHFEEHHPEIKAVGKTTSQATNNLMVKLARHYVSVIDRFFDEALYTRVDPE